MTLVGTTSGKGDGAITASATTGVNGSGATVSYTVASNVASAATLVAGGSGYQEGESISVSDDPGVTLTVSL